jgi:hypothetical protein
MQSCNLKHSFNLKQVKYWSTTYFVVKITTECCQKLNQLSPVLQSSSKFRHDWILLIEPRVRIAQMLDQPLHFVPVGLQFPHIA